MKQRCSKPQQPTEATSNTQTEAIPSAKASAEKWGTHMKTLQLSENLPDGPIDEKMHPCLETQRALLAGPVLNAEVGVTASPTLLFVISFVSTTPEREDEDHTDVVAEPNLRTIWA
nr:hypothetical protein [Tanacetum cinerariifolium]